MVSALNPFGQASEYAAGQNKGSTYFSGGSDQISISSIALGNGDFNIELWINAPQGSDDAIFDWRNVNLSTTGITLTVIDTDTIRLWTASGAVITANGLSYYNQWLSLYPFQDTILKANYFQFPVYIASLREPNFKVLFGLIGLGSET